jgi:hypothetical protein
VEFAERWGNVIRVANMERRHGRDYFGFLVGGSRQSQVGYRTVSYSSLAWKQQEHLLG